MYTLHPIPIFDDNYVWCLSHEGRALVVDPGDAAPVQAYLQAHSLILAAVLVTHHHADHTGGVLELLQANTHATETPGLYTADEAAERNRAWHTHFEAIGQSPRRVFLHGGERLALLGLDWQVLPVGAHTAGHVAFYAPACLLAEAQGASVAHSNPSKVATAKPLLFCGDTLFSAGCGRLFEGNAADLTRVMNKFAALPDDTQVCCTHEYTLSNLRFAQHVEPDNAAIAAHTARCLALRATGQPTLPSNLALERQINPYLRTSASAVQDWYAANRPQNNEGSALSGVEHGKVFLKELTGSELLQTAYDAEAVIGLLRAQKNLFAG